MSEPQAPAAEPAPTNGVAEAPPAAAPEQPAGDPQLQQQYRALSVAHAKKERELAHARKQLEEASGRLSPDEAIPLSEIKGNAKRAIELLAERAGVTFNEMAQAVVDGEAPPPSAQDVKVQQLEQTIAELKEQLGGVVEQGQTREQQERRSTRLQSIKSYVGAESDQYAVLNALGAHEIVLSHIENAERETGVGATNQDVIESLTEFEQKARSTISEQVKALAAVPWARELFETVLKPAADATDPPASEGQPADTKSDRKARRRSPTVTNAVASESATPADDDKRSLSKDSLIAAAAAKVKRRRAERGG